MIDLIFPTLVVNFRAPQWPAEPMERSKTPIVKGLESIQRAKGEPLALHPKAIYRDSRHSPTPQSPPARVLTFQAIPLIRLYFHV